MHIGVPKEIKNHEYRVGMTPAGVREAVARGHRVSVQRGAGASIGFSDERYADAGAHIAATAREVFADAELVVKVKEPQPEECAMMRKGQMLFTYLHLAPDPQQAQLLISSGCTAIAYETVTDARGRLPLLAPMSEVAGRLAPQMGAFALTKAVGGAGVLLGGVPGVLPARVTVIGGGVVGENAAKVALGMGAEVTLIDSDKPRLQELDRLYGPRLKTLHASADAIEQAVADSDMVVGAVLVPGATAPKLVSRAMLKRMRKGSALVDVSIDQGGCFETSRPTTHTDPIYEVDGIVHYCVANMPGAVARTATLALTAVTLPFALTLADAGWRRACGADSHLADGLNVHEGRIAHRAVAESLGLSLTPLATLLQ
ncbi:MAG TPA: alanine dehydrogenase [Burkholderiales bacterium]|nr:alanine dehydrogenase [Burkholderiales bacterium]